MNLTHIKPQILLQPKQVVVSLAVNDPEKSLAFYRDGLGLETSDIEEGIISIELANLSLFLIERSEFENYSKQGKASAHTSKESVECILSCALDSKEEVDDILQRAEAAGGSIPNPPKEESWGYTGYFKDPDGHLWEIVWSRREAE